MSEPDDEIIFPEAPIVGRMTCVSQERYAELMQQESRIAELEATLKRKDAEIVARGEYVERLKAQLAEYQDAEAIYKTKDVGQLVGEAESKWRPCWRYVRDPEWVGICGERVTKSDGGHGYCVLPPDPLKHPYNRHADVLPRDPHPPK